MSSGGLSGNHPPWIRDRDEVAATDLRGVGVFAMGIVSGIEPGPGMMRMKPKVGDGAFRCLERRDPVSTGLFTGVGNGKGDHG